MNSHGEAGGPLSSQNFGCDGNSNVAGSLEPRLPPSLVVECKD